MLLKRVYTQLLPFVCRHFPEINFSHDNKQHEQKQTRPLQRVYN